MAESPIEPPGVHRPRNVDWKRAAALLYGDWGTSKAYVIGLAFAVGGYASFWLIAAMCVLTALVGINYIIICRLYPDGGGVYASVRHRSEVISIVGAFLLIADYLVTAAISALSAFQYLGVPHPEKFAAAAILVIGLLNLLGPKHTGGLAFLISVPTAIVVVTLGLFSLPHLGTAFGNLQPLHGGFFENWGGFVGIVLALSGVEAIANATGVMPVGFMTRGSQSPWTRNLLAELDFTYDSNALDDDLPYWSQTSGGRMLILPYGFDTNDMKFFHPNGFVQPEDFSSYVGAALATLVSEAERGRSAMLSVGFHLRICGRPARFAAVQSILTELSRLGDRIWIAKREEIAGHFREIT